MSEAEEALPEGTKRWFEALTWHETLTEADASQLTSALVRDWQTWYADRENRRLFDHLSQLVVDGRAQRPRSQRWRADITNDEYDVAVPIAPWRKARIPSSARDRWLSPARWWLGLTGAVAIAVTAAIVVLMLSQPWGSVGARQEGASLTFRTGIGGLKKVHLSDGSDITLGGQTELRVDLSTQVRSVELIQGEAWFSVAHDPKWPFVVHAGDGAITAVGTAFLVTRNSDRVVVTVTEGTVTVSTAPLLSWSSSPRRAATSLHAAAPVRVTRGEEVSYRDNGSLASVVKADTHAATAWTRGRLIFDDEPLRYVIENVNRYFPRHISWTPAAGRLRFSGVIFDGEIEDWLKRLPDVVPVDVNADERGADICIRMRTVETNTPCTTAR